MSRGGVAVRNTDLDGGDGCSRPMTVTLELS